MVTDELMKKYSEIHFETTEGRFDIFELFIERGIKLCKQSQPLGFIIPSPLLTNLYSRKLRNYLVKNCAIEEITNFGMDVFEDPTIHTCIIVVNRGNQQNQKLKVRKQVNSIQQLDEDYDYDMPQIKLLDSDNVTFDIFIDPKTSEFIKKLFLHAEALGDVYYIRQCIKTGNDGLFVESFDSPPGDPWKKTLRGKSIGRYTTVENNLWLKYGEWLARNWKNTSFYETPKIALRETGNRITATIDLENCYFLSSLYALYPKAEEEPRSLLYILGVLNSLLANYFVKKIAFDITKGAFTKIRTNQLARFALHTIDFNNPTEKSRHDKMVELVERMLDLNKRLQEAETAHKKDSLQRQIAATDRQIDRLVYELYDLTCDEIKIVEGGLGIR